MKKANPHLLATVYGVAGVIFFIKAALAVFWQRLPKFGILYLLVALILAVLCAWTTIQPVRRSKQTEANNATHGNTARLRRSVFRGR